MQEPMPCKCKGNSRYPAVVTHYFLFIPLYNEIKCMRCCTSVKRVKFENAVKEWNRRQER